MRPPSIVLHDAEGDLIRNGRPWNDSNAARCPAGSFFTPLIVVPGLWVGALRGKSVSDLDEGGRRSGASCPPRPLQRQSLVRSSGEVLFFSPHAIPIEMSAFRPSGENFISTRAPNC